MPSHRPATIPIRLLLIPSALGIVAWFLMAGMTHGRLGLPSFVMPLSLVVLLIAIVIEIVAVPIGVRRLVVAPSLRTSGNLLVVAFASVFLLAQLLLTFLAK